MLYFKTVSKIISDDLTPAAFEVPWTLSELKKEFRKPGHRPFAKTKTLQEMYLVPRNRPVFIMENGDGDVLLIEVRVISKKEWLQIKAEGTEAIFDAWVERGEKRGY